MRIGLFGGTFNPIHSGHLKAAKEVKKGFALDRISFIPSALPPHKEPEGVVNPHDRMEMIRLAVADDSDFSISDVEQKRSGPSYTIDTVSYFKSVLPKDAKLYLIVGLDALLEMDTWKAYMDLFLLIPFIVMARPVPGCHDPSLMWKTLENYLKTKISDGYQFSPSLPGCVHPDKQPVFLFDFKPLDISSTKIRERIAKGRSIHRLVPEKVADYIKTKGLYR